MRTKYCSSQVTVVAMVMTNVTAMPMPTAELMRLLTPRKGQMPRNWASTILLMNIAVMIIEMYSSMVYSAFLRSLLTMAIRYPRAMKAPGASTKSSMP